MDADKIFITKFDTTAEYYTALNTMNLPNVSLTLDDGKVHYAPESSVIVRINVTQTSSAMVITHSTLNVSKIIIDGEDIGEVVDTYKFPTTGVHTIKFVLSSPDIEAEMFYGIEVETEGGDIMWEQIPIISAAISDGVSIIGSDAFGYCHSLTSVTIGSNVYSIYSYAFENCENLVSINLPYKLISIGNGAFLGCTSLTSVTIPNGVTGIGAEAFYGCSGLTSVVIPDSVTSIGQSAFYNCSGLTSVTIGNGVTSIGNSAFTQCNSLASIISLAATAPTITNSTFRSIKTGGTLYVPQGNTGYNVWMGTGNYYLGKYSWTMDTIDNMENIVAGGMD